MATTFPTDVNQVASSLGRLHSQSPYCNHFDDTDVFLFLLLLILLLAGTHFRSVGLYFLYMMRRVYAVSNVVLQQEANV